MNELERKKKISKRVGRSEWSREVINTGTGKQGGR